MKSPLNGRSRRDFLKTSSATVGALAFETSVWPCLARPAGKPSNISVSDLPKGAAPKPISFPYFPSRLHAFVWRNWPLVTLERMARVVRTKRTDILRMGRAMGEYSISAIGPGPRAERHWQLARERGLKTIAKIQAGNTWELSAVPYIPAVENVARHAENLRGANVDGLMLGWTLGGYPSPNLEVVSETLACGSADEAMMRVAERRFGEGLAPAVVTAWRGYSSAFREFPYHIGVVYSGPQQLGPANLLWNEATGYRATMVGFPYDDLDQWRAVYPPEVFIQQLDKVADGFDRGLDELRIAGAQLAETAPAERRALAEECGVAEAAAIHFRSSANQARFVLARRAGASQRAVMEQVLKDEIGLARRLHEIQSRDSRIGFEASNQYYYVPVDLIEKVLNCRHLLATTFKN